MAYCENYSVILDGQFWIVLGYSQLLFSVQVSQQRQQQAYAKSQGWHTQLINDFKRLMIMAVLQ